MSASTPEIRRDAPGEPTAETLITVSATYGAGGSVVAHALAERLGVPFLQRVTGTAADIAEPGRPHERLSDTEARRTPAHRLLAALTHAVPAGPTQCAPSVHHQDEQHRREGEAELLRFVTGGRGVVLGHAAAVVLGKQRGYHVRLDGPAERRLAQGASLEHVDPAEAAKHMRAADRARSAYVGRLYRVDPADPSLYHLVLDSTAIPLESVVELVLSAALSAREQRAP